MKAHAYINTSINTLGRCTVHIEAFGCIWMHLELYLGSGLGRWTDPSEGEVGDSTNRLCGPLYASIPPQMALYALQSVYGAYWGV